MDAVKDCSVFSAAKRQARTCDDLAPDGAATPTFVASARGREPLAQDLLRISRAFAGSRGRAAISGTPERGHDGFSIGCRRAQ
jgi:hypothetical protein